jgi:hypothetical protein
VEKSAFVLVEMFDQSAPDLGSGLIAAARR